MVIHGCIDGFSRAIVFLKLSNNNRANTVHGYFIDGICKFRTPLRIRTDHGTENVEVAKTMLEIRGVEARPVITGKSVHNQRIERLWVDTGFQVASFWARPIQRYSFIFVTLRLFSPNFKNS